ncbi:MAG: PfkB family carbohydrate kinase [Gemmatimonadetes bacterium]|nr:PfkB family carbohydrate kinase [Gemmatimonadota bacterium]
MDRARFGEVAAAFPRCRAVVLGDLMLDRYVTGTVARVSPEAPVPVVLVDDEWNAVGGAANVAANIRALGARCDVIGVVGADGAGRAIERTLETMGAACRLVADDRRSTTVKTRVLAQGQQVVRIDREETSAIAPDAERRLKAQIDERLSGAGVLILADYDKGVLSGALGAHALERAARLGVPTVVDPKRRDFFAFGGATVFKPNRAELEAALDEPVRPRKPEWMEAARARVGCDHLLVTLGAEGMALASPGGRLENVASRARSVYDVSGAGDIVSAVVAASLATGAGMAEAVVLAAHAAAVGVAKVGVATVTPEEIAELLPES